MTEQPDVLRYVAFAMGPGGGNPAGVVLADRSLPVHTMQRIAAEVGYSETAFLWPADASEDAAHFRTRYFSPVDEVAFCGHATIAAAVALGERDGPGLLRLQINDAVVEVETRHEDGQLLATLTSPPPHATAADSAALQEALAALGYTDAHLDASLPPAVAFAGATHLIVALAKRESLAALDYDFDRLRTLMTAQGWTTVAVVWREGPTRFHARNAFAVGGVVEDPATGAAAAALGGYLRHHGFVSPPATVEIIQGVDMGRPSRLLVAIGPDDTGIRVSGGATPITDSR